MNKSAFLQLIQQVSDITDQQTDELEKVASAFPYCQTAHLLLAKSAYDKGSMLSSQRLRRASSYATNRQLLKKIIYAVPAPPVPVYEETEATTSPEPEVPPVTDVPQEFTATAAPVVAAAEEKNEVPEESVPATQPERTSEAEAETRITPAAPAAPATQPEAETTPEESLYSELAMLLNINSLSSSSTDLLVAKPDRTTVAPAPFPTGQPEPAEEATDGATEEALQPAALPEADTPTTGPTEAETATDEEPANAQALPATAPVPTEEQQPAAAENEAPFGAVNYNSDEIDRLYAEDALGYWMGSSRMGEVLQLKDEVTRLRPQSFHPELILEYSKTHELEKAIQPASNVLSQQLNIIDQFLKLNPRLKTMNNLRMKEEPQEDLSLKSTRIKKGLASENLATIFLKQGKVKKAIKIYEQLLLKYPEKKTYFAEQIEKLQTLN